MKIFAFLSIIFTSIISNAQLNIAPAPAGGNIGITSSQNYVYFLNSGSSSESPTFSVDSNAFGISISSNRCSNIAPQRSCYIIVSFPNYGVLNSQVNVALRSNGTQIANLTYEPLNPIVESSSFSVSSLSMNEFSFYSFSIKNNTLSSKSYSPVISGTDSSKYSIVLNKCSNVLPKGSCTVTLKLNPQIAGSYSASISEPQVSGSISLSSLITGSTVGVVAPQVSSLSMSPSSIDLGTITKLGQSAFHVISITNSGNVRFTPIITLSGSGLNISMNRCSSSLAPGKSCSVSVFFNAVNTMTNGPLTGLSISAKTSALSAISSIPIVGALNIPPSLLNSSSGVVNPTYVKGKLSAGSSTTFRISPSGNLMRTGGVGMFGSNSSSSFQLIGSSMPLNTQFKYVSVSQNSDFFCGISTNDVTYCNDGYGFFPYSYYSPDMSGTGGQYFKEIHVGFLEWDLCGLTNQNRVYCWGNNDYGQLGDGSPITSNFDFSTVPVEIKMNGALAGKTIKKLVASVINKCVIASDDLVYCWGTNGNGEVGLGFMGPDINEPTQIKMNGALAGKTIKDISAASNGYCVIASDDKVYCWGAGSGTLTNNGTSDFYEPTMVVDTNNVLSGKVLNQISAGTTHVCAIANDNKIYCWGGNDSGQLGRGSSLMSIPSPPALVDMSVFGTKVPNSISSGYLFSCSTTTDDSLFCWGSNTNNNLGVSGGSRLSPVLVPNGY